MAKVIKIPFDVDTKRVKEAIGDFQNLNKSIGDTHGGIKDIKDGFKTLDFSKIISGTKDASDGFSNVAKSMRSFPALANPYVAAGAAITAALGGIAVAQYKIAEGSIKLAKTLKDLQREMGVTYEQAKRLMQANIALAEAAGQAASSVSGAIMALVNSAGAGMESAAQAVEKWGMILNPANFDKFKDSVEEYTASLTAMGFSINEITDVTGNLINNSQNVDKFFDSVVDSVLKMRNPTKELNEQLMQLGMGSTMKALQSGSITGKEAFDRLSEAILAGNKAGKDMSLIMDELAGAFKEVGAPALKFYKDSIDGSIQLTELQNQLLHASNELARIQVERAESAKDLLNVTKETELAQIKLNTAWERFVISLQNSGVFKFFETLKQKVLGVGEALLNMVSDSLYNFEGDKEFDKFMQQNLDKYRGRMAGEYNIEQAKSDYLKMKKHLDSNAAYARLRGEQLEADGKPKQGTNITPTGGTSPVVPKESALTEAESRLKLHITKVQDAINIALKNKAKTQEEANLESINAEAKHYEEVIALAISLQGTQRVVDGKTVEYAKLTEKELREIEVKRQQFKTKIRIAEIEKEIAYNKHILDLYLITEKDKTDIINDNIKKRQKILEIELNSELITWVKYGERRLALILDGIDREIQETRDGFFAKISTTKINHQELEKLTAEFNSKMEKLERDKNQAKLDDAVETNKKIVEIEKDTAAILEGLVARTSQTSATAGSMGFGSIFDSFASGKNKVNSLNQELSKTNKLIADDEKAAKEAANDPSKLKAITDRINANKQLKAQTEKEKTAEQITTAINMVGDATKAMFSAIDAGMQREIEMLDRQIEKRKEIFQLANQQFLVEEARLKTILDIEDARGDTRDKELEDLSRNIPEAQKESLEKEKEFERERREMRRKEVETNIANEKRRLKDIEGAQRVLENRKLAMQQKQFEAKRVSDITDILMSAAVAAVNLWAKPGFPAAIPLAIVLGGVTAASIAAVAAQKNPYTQRFAKGTLNVEGGVAQQDSVPALLMPGEAVLPTKVNTDYKETVEAIFNRRIPASVLNSIVKNYGKKESGTVFAGLDSKAIVEAIKSKPTSIVNIDEDGFKEFIVKTNEDYLLTKKRLGI